MATRSLNPEKLVLLVLHYFRMIQYTILFFFGCFFSVLLLSTRITDVCRLEFTTHIHSTEDNSCLDLGIKLGQLMHKTLLCCNQTLGTCKLSDIQLFRTNV